MLLHCLAIALCACVALCEECHPGKEAVFFLKMYKIGGETAVNSIRTGFGSSKTEQYFRVVPKKCFNPFSHDVAFRYKNFGLSGLELCLQEGLSKKCLKLLTLFRDPIERLISQIFFYRTYKNMIQVIISHSSGNTSEYFRCFDKFSNSTMSVTPDEMDVIVKILHGTHNRYPDVQPHMYLKTLATGAMDSFWEHTQPPSGALDAAISKMHTDFALIGVTESMSGFYVLYSKIFNVPLNTTCADNFKHGMGVLYKKKYKSKDRPPASTLLTADTYAYLQRVLATEIRIWEEAKKIHSEDLKRMGLTSESAHKIWSTACPALKPFLRNPA